MKSDDLLDAIGEAKDQYILDARSTQNKKTVWMKSLAVAACICLALSGAINMLVRFDFSFGGNCGANPGTIVDGVYYYFEPHKGVMRYVPDGESELVLSTFWLSEWDVNEYGIYYWRGLSLYVRDHETGTRRKLHSASRLECTHIRFELRDDGNVLFIGYNKNTEVRYELLLDGITGEIIDTVMDPVSYDDFIFAYSESHQVVGNREILFVPLGDKRYDSRADVMENGVRLLPEGMSASVNTRHWADALWIRLYAENNSDNTETYLVLYPDGENRTVTIPAESYCGGAGNYLFYPSYTDEYETEWGMVCCTDVTTGETWELDVDTYTDDLYSPITDGKYLYSTAPWDDGHACWEVIYGGNGKPVAIRLIAEDITK